MPTSYTSLLGLALPVTGELSGTWGDTVNDYITQYLDASVAGTQTISGSQTAVTLSKTTASSLSQAGAGSTGSSQYMIINCTGNPAGLLTITAPAASKPYIVINATSTSQSVKIVGVGPTTGVTIPSGQRALVAWNGSDFVQVGASAGGSNTQVQFNSSGALAGSANLTFDGTTLSAAAIADASLTSGRVTYAGASGNLTDSANLTFDGTTLTANDIIDSSLTANKPVFTNGSKNLVSTGTLGIDQGGTGQTTASAAFNALSPITTTGDLIIGNGTNSATRLAIGSNGFVLTSNGTTASWAASSGGVTSFSAGTTGFTPSTGTTGAVTLAGTLSVANGGTGQTTYTNGQLLIGNTTGNTLTKATLTAGAGITITNGSGSITIASTSGTAVVGSAIYLATNFGGF